MLQDGPKPVKNLASARDISLIYSPPVAGHKDSQNLTCYRFHKADNAALVGIGGARPSLMAIQGPQAAKNNFLKIRNSVSSNVNTSLTAVNLGIVTETAPFYTDYRLRKVSAGSPDKRTDGILRSVSLGHNFLKINQYELGNGNKKGAVMQFASHSTHYPGQFDPCMDSQICEPEADLPWQMTCRREYDSNETNFIALRFQAVQRLRNDANRLKEEEIRAKGGSTSR